MKMGDLVDKILRKGGWNKKKPKKELDKTQFGHFGRFHSGMWLSKLSKINKISNVYLKMTFLREIGSNFKWQVLSYWSSYQNNRNECQIKKFQNIYIFYFLYSRQYLPELIPWFWIEKFNAIMKKYFFICQMKWRHFLKNAQFGSFSL